LSFEAHTGPEPIQTLPGTAALGAHPHAEVSVLVPALDAAALVGTRFSVPRGYDAQEEDHVATLYYCEHEDLDDNVIEILSRHDDIFRVRWTGSTTDLSVRKITSPFDSRVRYNVFSMFRILETHERRHLWQAEQAVSRAM
jgi:hypothetical protein